MNKLLCFIIDGKELYLDKALVNFNQTPIFFTCRDSSNDYYLALCSDINNLEYIVEKQEIRTLWQMLTQKISMRRALLSTNCFWLVQSGESIAEDVVEKKSISQIDFEVLPEDNALYEQIDEGDKQYVEQITSKYLSETEFKANPNIEGIEDLSIDTAVLMPSDLMDTVQHFRDFGPESRTLFRTICLDIDVNDNRQVTFLYEGLSEQKETTPLRIDLFNHEVDHTQDSSSTIAA